MEPEPRPFTQDERALLQQIVNEQEPGLRDLVARLLNEELVPRAEIEPLDRLLFDEWSKREGGPYAAFRLVDDLIGVLYQHTSEFWA